MARLAFVPYRRDDRQRRHLLSGQNYLWHELRVIETSVGFFPDLQLGGFWTSGIQDRYPDYEELFVTIDASFCSTQSIAAFTALNTTEILIGNRFGQQPLDVGLSHVASFPIPDRNMTLIVPCTEVFRFYYGTSSRLAVAFLDGTFLTERWKIVNARFTQPLSPEGRAELMLGAYVKDTDAQTVGRVVYSDEARDEAEALIPRAITRSAHQRFPVIIRPPFRSTSNLHVLGRWLSSRGRHRTFFAMQIVSCSSPFPWKIFSCGRQNPPPRNRESEAETKPAFAGSFRHVLSSGTGESLKATQSDDPAYEDVGLEAVSQLSATRFTSTYVVQPYEYGKIRHHSASAQDTQAAEGSRFSIGSGKRGSKLRGLTLVAADEHRELADRLRLFNDALLFLPSLDTGIRITLKEVYEIAPKRPLGGPVLHRPWAYIDSYAGQKPRRVAFAVLWFRTRSYLLIEIEPRTNKPSGARDDALALPILRNPSVREISRTDAESIVECLIVAKGIVDGADWKITQYARWFFDTVRHQQAETAGRYAQRMLEHLRSGGRASGLRSKPSDPSLGM